MYRKDGDYMDSDFEEVLQDLKEDIRKDMVGTFIQDKDRMYEVRTAINVFSRIIDCDDIKERVDEPFIGSADILMSGKEIHIKNPTVLCELLKHADVAEIVPVRNGDISFNVTYYGTSRKVVED